MVMDIWDTAGQEKYRSLLTLYYKNCDGIIMVFDLTRPETIETVKYWNTQINTHCETNPVVILAGNKSDLKDQIELVSQSKIKNYARDRGWHYSPCSAKTGDNIHEIFAKMGEEVFVNSKRLEK